LDADHGEGQIKDLGLRSEYNLAQQYEALEQSTDGNPDYLKGKARNEYQAAIKPVKQLKDWNRFIDT
jgi:hypothetical protein